MTSTNTKHKRVYVPTRRYAGGEPNAHAKCECGWVVIWPHTQSQAADAYRAHLHVVTSQEGVPRAQRYPGLLPEDLGDDPR